MAPGDLELIHNGLQQKEPAAKSIVLDECKWSSLFNGNGSLLLGAQPEFGWIPVRKEGERRSTRDGEQALPAARDQPQHK